MAAKKLGAEFTYDLSELVKVDPNLIGYRESAAIDTGMREPRGIAVGGEGLIVVAGDKAVRLFTDDGKPTGEFETPEAPQAVAATTENGIYLAMKDHVEMYIPDGKRQDVWEKAGPNALFTSIALGATGIFVADAGNRMVLRYLGNRAEGPFRSQIAGRIGEKDDARGIPGFVVPSPYFDVAVGPQDTLWVANPGRRRVERYTFDGNLVSSWGKASPKIEGFCGCCNPTHIAALPDGGLVTSEKGLARVKTYTAGGELVSVVAPPAAFAEGTVGLDVAADSRGRILVLDPVARKVRVFVRKTAPAEAKP
jgi:hypothetical protein